MKPITLYRFAVSGHCHRVELMLSLLELPFELVEVDLTRGEHRRPEFLQLNPAGQVPVIVDDGVVIADSNAILVYLALRYGDATGWLPKDPIGAAEVQRWLSIAAGPLVNGPALARVAALFKRPLDVEPPRQVARQLFERMDKHLTSRRFLLGDHATLADLAMYTYVAHAPEGGISLIPYNQLRHWLTHVEALPGFIPMQATATDERAKLSGSEL